MPVIQHRQNPKPMRSIRSPASPLRGRPAGAFWRVEKWYLDCVTPAGAGMIGYAARIRWGPLAVPCSETLVWRSGEPATQSHTALCGPLPAQSSSTILWRNRALKVDGSWRRRGTAIAPLVLHAEPAGLLEWSCCCPAGDAAVTIGGEPREGLGYAERLILTLPPGLLPIRELRWGRFVSEEQGCVWIHWRGERERTWCFHNGEAVAAVMPGGDPKTRSFCTVEGAAPSAPLGNSAATARRPPFPEGSRIASSRHELAWNGHQLKLEAGTIIRAGRVADTAFKQGRLLRWLLPSAVAQLRETKWCSRAVLTDDRGREHAGWAIHEVALFP